MAVSIVQKSNCVEYFNFNSSVKVCILTCRPDNPNIPVIVEDNIFVTSGKLGKKNRLYVMFVCKKMNICQILKLSLLTL